MKVLLKDGSSKEYAEPMAIIDIAKDISEGLARVACVAELDGEAVDLRTVVDGEHELNILTFDRKERQPIATPLPMCWRRRSSACTRRQNVPSVLRSPTGSTMILIWSHWTGKPLIK